MALAPIVCALSCLPAIDDLEECVTSDGEWATIAFATSGGEFSAEFVASPRDEGLEAFIGLAPRAISDASQASAAVRLTPSGSVTAVSDNGFPPAEGVTYRAREQLRFRLAGDVAIQRYSAFVVDEFTGDDGNDEAEQIIAMRVMFPADEGPIGALGVSSVGGATRICQVSFAVDESPMTCVEQFGAAPGFALCDHTATTCSFNVDKGRALSCDEVCGGNGGRCVAAFLNAGPCERREPTECDLVGADSDICVCSRQP